MPNIARRTVALAVLAVAIIAVAVALDLSSAAAQSDEQAGRIVARRLDDGRTEFGWQPIGKERVLPSGRFFPANVDHQRWLRSTPVEVGGAEIGRINAPQLPDGRIEFAFMPADGQRILPPSRYFPAGAAVGRWLRSTQITISAATGNRFTTVSAGSRHTCGLRETGEIVCWGNNEYGQTDAPSGRFSAISMSGSWWSHACGLRSTGAVDCWGWNEHGQADAPGGRFSAVSAGADHTCGLRESGAVECWGSNTVQRWNPETGGVETTYAGQAAAPPGRFSTVSAGTDHTCGLRENSEVVCWGNDNFGQTDAPSGRFSAVSAGSGYTCGLRDDGKIVCWWSDYLYPFSDMPDGVFRAISVGGWHSCGVRPSGAIECWENPRSPGE